jgi:hypothetical protein
MGQAEIYELMKNKLLSGDTAFYSSEDIYKDLKYKKDFGNIVNLKRAISRLFYWGSLERKMYNNIPKYRLKKKLLDSDYL